MQQINLYQAEFRRQHNALSAPALARVVVAVATGLALITIYGEVKIRALDGQLRQSAMRYEQVQTRVLAYQAQFPPKLRSELLQQRLERAKAGLALQQQIEQVLSSGAFGNTEGFSSQLMALARQRVPGAWLTRIVINNGGDSIGLAGHSTAPELIPAYVQRLGAEAAFKGQGFSAMDIRRNTDDPRTVDFSLRSSGINAEDADG